MNRKSISTKLDKSNSIFFLQIQCSVSVLDASLNELITPILSEVFEPIHVRYQNKIDILCLKYFFSELAAQLVDHLL